MHFMKDEEVLYNCYVKLGQNVANRKKKDTSKDKEQALAIASKSSLFSTTD